MARMIVLAGTVLLLVVVGGGAADYTRLKQAEDRALEGKTLQVPRDAITECGEPPTGQYFSVASYRTCVARASGEFTSVSEPPNRRKAELRRRDWDRHVVWFAFGSLAVVVLTAAAAWALPARMSH